MSDHLDRLAAERQTILRQFQRSHAGSNCPATAQAVQHFLRTGEIRAARRVMGGDAFVNCGTPFQTASLQVIIRRLRRGGHGSQFVVGGFSPSLTQPTRQHYFNLVNIRGTVYYIDAYTSPPAFSDNVTRYTDWARVFQFTPQFNIRFVPEGAPPSCP